MVAIQARKLPPRMYFRKSRLDCFAGVCSMFSMSRILLSAVTVAANHFLPRIPDVDGMTIFEPADGNPLRFLFKLLRQNRMAGITVFGKDFRSEEHTSELH